jgi:hypothetical protein
MMTMKSEASFKVDDKRVRPEFFFCIAVLPPNTALDVTAGLRFPTLAIEFQVLDVLGGLAHRFHHIQKRVPCPSRVLCERAGL